MIIISLPIMTGYTKTEAGEYSLHCVKFRLRNKIDYNWIKALVLKVGGFIFMQFVALKK